MTTPFLPFRLILLLRPPHGPAQSSIHEPVALPPVVLTALLRRWVLGREQHGAQINQIDALASTIPDSDTASIAFNLDDF